MRRDSLGGHLDVELAKAQIENELPRHFNFWANSEINFTFGFPMNPEDGRIVANLVLEYIDGKLN